MVTPSRSAISSSINSQKAVTRRQYWKTTATDDVKVLNCIYDVDFLGFSYGLLNGLGAVRHLEFFVNTARPVGVPGGGVGHALVGTGIMVGIASLMAIPVGVLGGIYLAEFRTKAWANWVRLASDVLVGTPSIAIGLVVYALLVAPLHHFSALSGSIALALLMLPVVVRTTEGSVRLVPDALREAGLVLGLPRWRVSLQLVLRAAVSGVVTGALLSVARAAGETAPLLFTGFGSHVYNLDPRGPMAALPLVVFQDALTPYPTLQEQAWGAALVLVVVVLLTNLLSRLVLRRQLAMAGKIS